VEDPGLMHRLQRSSIVGVDPGTAWKDLAVVDFAVPRDGWPWILQSYSPGREMWCLMLFIEAWGVQQDGSKSSHCSCNVPSSVIVDPLSSSGDSSAISIMHSAIVKVVAEDVVFSVRLVVDLLGYRVVGGYVTSKFWVCGDEGCIDAPTIQVFETSDQIV
jgi:hypothetical protein